MEQLSRACLYPAEFKLTISDKGFCQSSLYDEVKSIDKMNYLSVVQKLIKELQDTGWNIDLNDCDQKDGYIYFYLNEPKAEK